MANINHRVFGSPIPKIVKQILEQRQLLAKEAEPNKSLWYDDDEEYSRFVVSPPINFNTNSYYNAGDEFNSVADLSSRTPFARMWTAVELHDYGKETREEIVFDTDSLDPSIKEGSNEFEDALDAFHKTMPNKSGYIGPLWDSTERKFFYKKIIGTQVDGYERKVYAVGNHVLGTLETSPSQELQTIRNRFRDDGVDALSEQEKQKFRQDLVFPNEHGVFNDNNKFLKPPAGITSLTSETVGTLGAIRETNITFEVHNFHDFENIYDKYFMRPGAQIFVDWGWDPAELYDPEDIIELPSIQEALFKEPDEEYGEDGGYVSRTMGYSDTVVGLVTEYNSQIQENGSVICSLKITSKNTALLSNNSDSDVASGLVFRSSDTMKWILDHLIRFDGLVRIANASQDEELANSIPEINQNTTSSELTLFENWLKDLTMKNFKQKSFIPSEQALVSGVFVRNKGNITSAGSVYVNFGKLEDFIFNKLQGEGEDLDAINSPDHKNFEISFDSSESMTYYSTELFNWQRDAHETGERAPSFVYPERWYVTSDGENTYNNQVGKYPKRYDEMEDNLDPKEIFQKDLNLKQIPIRELFIDASMLIDRFNTGDNFYDGMQSFLDFLRGESHLLMDLKLVAKPGEDNSMSIIDYSYTKGSKEIDTKTGEKVSEEDIFENLFMFDLTSGNSIVKNYQLELKIPDGALGNMLAIQGISPDNQLLVMSPEDDQLLSLQELFDKDDQSDNKDQKLHIKYMPNITGYQSRAKSSNLGMLESQKLLYETIQTDSILGAAPGNSGYGSSGLNKIMRFETYKERASSPSEDDEIDEEAVNLDKVDKNEAMLKDESIEVLGTVNEYYSMKTRTEFFGEERPTPLPIFLSLTTYGISSVNVGDIFRVNYLPKVQRENVYFQIMSIRNAIGTDGWYTTFETQYRIRPVTKSKSNLRKPPKDVVISTNIIKKMGFKRPRIPATITAYSNTYTGEPDFKFGIGWKPKIINPTRMHRFMTYVHKFKPQSPMPYSEVRQYHGTIRKAGSTYQEFEEPDDDALCTTFTCEITPEGHGQWLWYNSLRGVGYEAMRLDKLYMFDENFKDTYPLSGDPIVRSMGWRCRLNRFDADNNLRTYYFWRHPEASDQQFFMAPTDGSSPYAYGIRGKAGLSTPSHDWWWKNEPGFRLVGSDGSFYDG